MKIAYMGTPEFALTPLQRLIESPHEVALVVTQPSKPKGRGLKVEDPPVKELADEQGLEVLQPRSLRKEPIDDEIRRREIDVIVVAAYGKILPPSLLKAPRLGCINIHASMLPEYRGAAPIQRAIMDGHTETGVTIMKMSEEMDAGPLMAQQMVEIHDDDDARSLAHILSAVGADLLLRVLDEVEKEGRVEGVPQDEQQATYAPRITAEEGRIDWNLSSVEIMCRLRGLTPWPGLYTNLGDKRLRILRAEPVGAEQARHDKLSEDVPPGAVSGIVKGFGFTVKTGDGHLLIDEVQQQGKREMNAEEFLRGARLQPGAKLGTDGAS